MKYYTALKKFVSSCLLIVILILLAISNNNCRNAAKTNRNLNYINYSDKFGFSFNIPKEYSVVTADELNEMREMNQTLAFVAIVSFPFGNRAFSVSAYDLHEETSIDTAFARTVRHVPITADESRSGKYKVLGHGKWEFYGKTLRYKFSLNINQKDTLFNIMYYYMKNDFSDILYETKIIASSENEIETVTDFLDNIALTVMFLDKKDQ
jgi:hypothetical protein